MRAEPDFEKLILGCKRAVNILQQASKEFGYEGPTRPLEAGDLEAEAERELLEATNRVGREIASRMESTQYEQVLQELVGLKGAIDRLFDEVMVLVDDARLRENRLHLLARVSELFEWYADFSKISL